MKTEYERPPTDEDERPRRKKREKHRPFMNTRSPYDCQPIRVYDDENPDEKIEEYIAKGRDKWLERNDPEKAAAIRAAYITKLNERDKGKK